MNKIDQLEKFLNSEGIFDIVITKEENDGVRMGAHHVVDIVFQTPHIILPKFGYRGQVTENGISEITTDSITIHFKNEDDDFIQLKIVRRLAK